MKTWICVTLIGISSVWAENVPPSTTSGTVEAQPSNTALNTEAQPSTALTVEDKTTDDALTVDGKIGNDTVGADALVLPQAASHLEKTPISLITSMLLILFLIAAGCFAITRYLKRGNFRLRNRENRLQITETKMLGNRQFLLVAEYGNQRILLGVSPSGIQHLCYLESESTEKDFPELKSPCE